jgi:hypothetical protein
MPSRLARLLVGIDQATAAAILKEAIARPSSGTRKRWRNERERYRKLREAIAPIADQCRPLDPGDFRAMDVVILEPERRSAPVLSGNGNNHHSSDKLIPLGKCCLARFVAGYYRLDQKDRRTARRVVQQTEHGSSSARNIAVRFNERKK